MKIIVIYASYSNEKSRNQKLPSTRASEGQSRGSSQTDNTQWLAQPRDFTAGRTLINSLAFVILLFLSQIIRSVHSNAQKPGLTGAEGRVWAVSVAVPAGNAERKPAQVQTLVDPGQH